MTDIFAQDLRDAYGVERAGFEQGLAGAGPPGENPGETENWLNRVLVIRPSSPIPALPPPPAVVQQQPLGQRVRRIYGNCTTAPTRTNALSVPLTGTQFEIHVGRNSNRAKTGAFPEHYAFLNVPVCSSCFGLRVTITPPRNVSTEVQIHSNDCANRLKEVDTNVFVVYHTNAASFPTLLVPNPTLTDMEPLPMPSWVFCLARGAKTRPYNTPNDYTISCICPFTDNVSFCCIYKP